LHRVHGAGKAGERPFASERLIAEQSPLTPAERGDGDGKFEPVKRALVRSMLAFEKLNGAFVLLRFRARRKRSEVPPLAGFRVELSGIEPILAGFQFADHGSAPARRVTYDQDV
jgi:hypothetical protein